MTSSIIKNLVMAALLLIALDTGGTAEVLAADFRGPWGQDVKRQASMEPEGRDSVFSGAVAWYQRVVSPAAGQGRCPMYPSCSAYSRKGFAEKGFFWGFVMTCDRLMRCGRDETRLAPKVWVDGRELTVDPLEANQF
ncbi:MAG: membrane protein insertion efficiency factor YidD [Desulfatibacillaceae bacterium]|nr:membrane protein insertion efficiency factor YidD [Desulfatibacillaceae bacterium]